MRASILYRVRRDRRVSLMLVALLAIAQIGDAALPVGAADPLTAQQAIVHTETKLGPTAVQMRIAITVALAPLVTQQGMDDFLRQLADPTSPAYQQYLTPQQFTARFLDPKGRVAVADFLTNNGLTVTDPGVGSLVHASGTVGQMERAFAVTLNDYRDANGKTFYANDKTPALPTTLAPRITAVLGLDNAPKARPHFATPTKPTPHTATPTSATGCAGATGVATATGPYTPNQFATAFGFDPLYASGLRGEGQTLALFELSDWSTTDSDTYKSCFGSTTPVNRVNVDGGTTDTSGADEDNLDIDVVIGMLPKLAALTVYVGPNTAAGIVDTYQRMATDNSAPVLSTSWGQCEFLAGTPGTVPVAENTIFFQMATQGQQLFDASGDDGSEDCYRQTTPATTDLSVDDPAGQPYAVAVGGTTVTINSTTNVYVSETVWNDNFGTGGGGGLSQNWARPSWQTGPGTTNAYSNGKREVPDVAAPADPYTGYVVFSGGVWRSIGGTSGAAPFMAAGIALVDQAYMARTGHRLGFITPSLYQLLTNHLGVFHDVTVGNNCAQPLSTCATAGNEYPATAAYDLATGVGTPNFQGMANVLVPPNVVPAPRPQGIPPGASNPLPTPRPQGVTTGSPNPLPNPRP